MSLVPEQEECVQLHAGGWIRDGEGNQQQWEENSSIFLGLTDEEGNFYELELTANDIARLAAQRDDFLIAWMGVL